MNPAIERATHICVRPELAPKDLFVGLGDVCEEARRVISSRRGDHYVIPVELVSISGDWIDYEDAIKVIKAFGARRELSVVELLNLFLRDPNSRTRHPIIAGDFVLDHVPTDYHEATGTASFEWRLEHLNFYRGFPLDKNTVFATTPLTDIEKGTFEQNLDRCLYKIFGKDPLRLTA